MCCSSRAPVLPDEGSLGRGLGGGPGGVFILRDDSRCSPAKVSTWSRLGPDEEVPWTTAPASVPRETDLCGGGGGGCVLFAPVVGESDDCSNREASFETLWTLA